MSILSSLHISRLRNLIDVKVELSPTTNVFYGANGSGKSSFLESIHFLGLGRSFRSRLVNAVINHHTDSLCISGKVQFNGTLVPIGIERNRSSDCKVRIAGENASSIISLAEILPLQLIYPDGHQLLNAGPQFRRQFIDWGVFHVEQSFYELWQRAQRAIRQRNALLKSYSATQADIRAWNIELDEVSNKIHAARTAYVHALQEVFVDVLNTILPGITVKVFYQRGWDKDSSLMEVLERSYDRDKQIGYTQYGPHRADLWLRTQQNKPVHETLSQGQQKLVIYALRFAQGKLLKTQAKKTCIFLIDDLPAELDEEKRYLIAQLLKDIESQVFITGIEKSLLAPFLELSDSKMFHVEHGIVS